MRTFCNRNTFYNRYRHKKVRIFGKFAFILKCERSHFKIYSRNMQKNEENCLSFTIFRQFGICNCQIPR